MKVYMQLTINATQATEGATLASIDPSPDLYLRGLPAAVAAGTRSPMGLGLLGCHQQEGPKPSTSCAARLASRTQHSNRHLE